MPHDPQKARQLLSAAGYDSGFEAQMKIPRVPGAPIIADLASLIKDQLGKVGINLLLDEVELGTFIANVILPGNFDLAFFPNLPYDEPDRPLSFYHTRGVTGVGNWNNYTNPELDKLIDAQESEFDEAKRIDDHPRSAAQDPDGARAADHDAERQLLRRALEIRAPPVPVLPGPGRG